MKGKRSLAIFMAVSIFMTNGGFVYAAKETENTKEETVVEIMDVIGKDNIENKMFSNKTSAETDESVTGLYTDDNGVVWGYGCATEKSGNMKDYQVVIHPGEAILLFCDAQNAINKQILEVPAYVNGYKVIATRNEALEENENAVEVKIPSGMVHFVADTHGLFYNYPKLERITVEKGNPYFYDMDGILYGKFESAFTASQAYSNFGGAGVYLIQYPEGRKEECISLPNVVNEAKFYNLQNRHIICPNSMRDCMLYYLSDCVINLCYTNLEREFYGYMLPSFYGLELVNCKIIVKNQEMKKLVETELDNCTNTIVKTESEAKADEELKNYLIPATSLTLDGTTVIDKTLIPDGSCDYIPSEDSRLKGSWEEIDYQISPINTTDTVTWTSSNPNVAEVKVFNGRSILFGVSDGKCIITGTTESGKKLILNVKVHVSVKKLGVGWGTAKNGIVVSSYDIDDPLPGTNPCYTNIYVSPSNATNRNNIKYNVTGDTSAIKFEDTDNGGGGFKLTYYHAGTITVKASLNDEGNIFKQTLKFICTRGIDKCKIQSIEDKSYTGKDIKPSITIKDGFKTLKEGTDYTVTYSNNKQIGTAKAKIKGKGVYTGSKTVSFDIVKGKPSQSISNVSSSYEKSYKSTFTLKPKTKTSCTYKSSNSKIAMVDSKGKVTIKGTGKATITITAKETSKYKKATKKVTIYAVPVKMNTPTLKVGSKQLTVRWENASKADGYQIQYSTSKKFKNAKTVTCSKNKTTKATIKKLKSGKKYYVRIRAYKKIDNKKYPGSYSKVKSVKVK